MPNAITRNTASSQTPLIRVRLRASSRRKDGTADPPSACGDEQRIEGLIHHHLGVTQAGEPFHHMAFGTQEVAQAFSQQGVVFHEHQAHRACLMVQSSRAPL